MEVNNLLSDNWIVGNLQSAFNTWNDKLTEIWSLVTTSPETFRGGASRLGIHTEGHPGKEVRHTSRRQLVDLMGKHSFQFNTPGVFLVILPGEFGGAVSRKGTAPISLNRYMLEIFPRDKLLRDTIK